jgi:hypothetical protein
MFVPSLLQQLNAVAVAVAVAAVVVVVVVGSTGPGL